MKETKTAIAAALLKSQKEMPNVSKDSDNPFFHSKYASLTAVLDVVKPVLNANGIVIIQNPIEGKDGLGCLALETILLHESGESISSISVVPLAKGDAQAWGSALSYAKRYSLAAMTGLATEDDDGQRASHKPGEEASPAAGRVQSTAQPAKPPATGQPEAQKGPSGPTDAPTYGRKGYISEKQGKRLWAIAKAAGVTEAAVRVHLKKTFGSEHFSDIKWQDYDGICEWVEQQQGGGNDIEEPIDEPEYNILY